MKNITKTRLHVLFLAAMLLPTWVVQAQDKILNLFQYDEHSIVRTVDNTTWLVYSHGKSNIFNMVTPSGGTVSYKQLADDKLKILDFEIFEDYVFFCGVLDPAAPDAIMGYFSLSNFPTSTVYFDTLEEWAEFSKLDVFRVEDQLHVVMTAKYHNGKGTMVDAREYATNSWAYCDADFRNKYYSFFDVAVTDSYVVFTSWGNDIQSPFYLMQSILWIIQKPTSSGLPIFNNATGYMHKAELLDGSFGDILIKHTSGDDFVISSKVSIGLTLGVSFFSGLNYSMSKLINCNSYDVLGDLSACGLPDNIVALLRNPTSSGTIRSGIVWTSYPSTPPPLGVTMRYSTTEYINSIDLWMGATFAASGHEFGVNNLNAYYISAFHSGHCFQDLLDEDTERKFGYEYDKTEFPQRSFPYPMKIMDSTDDTFDPEITCE